MDGTEMIGRTPDAFEEFKDVDRDLWSRQEWARRIKMPLCGDGRKLDSSVCASNVPNADSGEFLHDVCWLHGESRLKWVPMAAQCAWGNFGYIEDESQ